MTTESKYNITPFKFNKLSSEEKILKMASILTPPRGKSEDEVLDSLLAKIDQPTSTKTIPLKQFIQTAAAIVILILSIYSVHSFLIVETVKTKFAEQTKINLPDGTEVKLNAGSKLVWNNKQFTRNRELTLKGEAYFDVKKGNEFIIKTKKGRVEILGTRLNVFSRGNDFRVSCISGKVRVLANNQQRIITPGELVELTADGLMKSSSATIDNTISWKDGIFHFEDTPLSAIFAELERQFNVSVKIEGNSNRLATVDFSNENLIETLDVVCIPMELSYEIKNNKKIIISEKK